MCPTAVPPAWSPSVPGWTPVLVCTLITPRAVNGPCYSGTQLRCLNTVGLYPVGEDWALVPWHALIAHKLQREKNKRPGVDLACTDASWKQFINEEDLGTGICLLKRAGFSDRSFARGILMVQYICTDIQEFLWHNAVVHKSTYMW